MNIHWGWAAVAFVLTAVLLLMLLVVAIWATFGTGLVDLLFWGLALVLVVTVVLGISWPSVLTFNAALIWFLVTSFDGDWLGILGRSVVFLIVLNIVLLAICHARRRACTRSWYVNVI